MTTDQIIAVCLGSGGFVVTGVLGVLTYFAKKFFDSADKHLSELPGIRTDMAVHSTKIEHHNQRLDNHEHRIGRLEEE